uniref:Chemokine interleukin-8-like domain-containing protein n=1 Tax=Neolamprologus brichardi TaxID=32507 RepID=A0A3Q4HVE7_NEOBR
MAISQRNFAVLLVVVAAACVELYQAQTSIGRCVCPSAQAVKGKISDFQVLEKRPSCDKTELIVTRINSDNSTQKLCMPTVGVRAKRLLSCWESINKNETRKMECIDRPKTAGNSTTEK